MRCRYFRAKHRRRRPRIWATVCRADYSLRTNIPLGRIVAGQPCHIFGGQQFVETRPMIQCHDNIFRRFRLRIVGRFCFPGAYRHGTACRYLLIERRGRRNDGRPVGYRRYQPAYGMHRRNLRVAAGPRHGFYRGVFRRNGSPSVAVSPASSRSSVSLSSIPSTGTGAGLPLPFCFVPS